MFTRWCSVLMMGVGREWWGRCDIKTGEVDTPTPPLDLPRYNVYDSAKMVTVERNLFTHTWRRWREWSARGLNCKSNWVMTLHGRCWRGARRGQVWSPCCCVCRCESRCGRRCGIHNGCHCGTTGFSFSACWHCLIKIHHRGLATWNNRRVKKEGQPSQQMYQLIKQYTELGIKKKKKTNSGYKHDK